MRTSSQAVSLTLALAVAASVAAVSRAAAPHIKPHSSMTSAMSGSVAHGKALVASSGCANCHGANLAGRKGFAPSLHETGVLKEYNAATFARVMNTGETNDGDHVKKPMPVYHMKKADGTAIYAYLKTFK